MRKDIPLYSNLTPHKLIPYDPTSLQYNIFAPQMSRGGRELGYRQGRVCGEGEAVNERPRVRRKLLMERQIENGMPYTMFTKQYHMTVGLELLSSNRCYGRRLENADSTLLFNMPQSQAANTFKKGNVPTLVRPMGVSRCGLDFKGVDCPQWRAAS